MSDDLVKRLLTSWDADRNIISQTENWMKERREGADRIEQLAAINEELEKERDDYAFKFNEANNTYTEMHIALEAVKDRVRELEAKLARAVVMAVQECPYQEDTRSYRDWWSDRRTTLAELQGDKT